MCSIRVRLHYRSQGEFSTLLGLTLKRGFRHNSKVKPTMTEFRRNPKTKQSTIGFRWNLPKLKLKPIGFKWNPLKPKATGFRWNPPKSKQGRQRVQAELKIKANQVEPMKIIAKAKDGCCNRLHFYENQTQGSKAGLV